jgi:hypothetical protein
MKNKTTPSPSSLSEAMANLNAAFKAVSKAAAKKLRAMPDGSVQISENIVLRVSRATARRICMSDDELRKELAAEAADEVRYLEERRRRKEYGWTNRYGSPCFSN